DVLDQYVELDRQAADTPAGRVEDRVGDRGGDAGDADLADAARPDRVEVAIILVAEADVDLADVGVHRHVVLGEVGVDEASVALVEQRLFHQRHAHAPDDAAHELAAREL